MTTRPFSITAVLLAAGVAFGGAAPADAAIPSFSGCGKFVKDPATDATDTVADNAGGAPAETEIEAAWVDAGGSPSINIQIANLTGSVPPPATSITYDAIYSFTSGTTNFVRAFIDFSGAVVYEYGHTEPLGPSTRYAYDGDIKGELFTGEHGVVRMEVPAEAGGKPGNTIKTVTAETQLGRTTVVPGAVNQSPSRGLSFQNDNAPLGNVTIGTCAAPAPGGGGGAPSVGDKPAPTDQGAPGTPAPLPVTLATKKLKPAKAKKTVKLTLKASEPLTGIAVRLAKGRTAYGTGKLAKLGKSGTLKVKLKKAIKKGTYTVDVAGTDAKGARRLASLKLKVG